MRFGLYWQAPQILLPRDHDMQEWPADPSLPSYDGVYLRRLTSQFRREPPIRYCQIAVELVTSATFSGEP